MNKPRLEARDRPYMRAYDALDGSRTWGMSAPNPLSLTEVQAYCTLAGIASQREKLKYLSVIQRLDQAYLTEWAAKNNKN